MIHPVRLSFAACLLLALMAFSFFADASRAQGTAADYARSDGLRERWQDKVYRVKVEPQWFAANRYCWYRVRVASDQHEFVVVDVERGRRELAFDHGDLARQLAEQLGREIHPYRLPFESLSFPDSPTVAEFEAGGKRWQYDRHTGKLTNLGKISATNGAAATPPATPPAFASPGGATSSPRSASARTAVAQPLSQNREASGQSHAVSRVEQATADFRRLHVEQQLLLPSALNAVVQRQQGARSERGRVSPDQQWEIAVRDHNLTLIDRRNASEQPLTRNGTADHPYLANCHWSPDSKKVVVFREKRAQQHSVYLIESAPGDQLQPKLHSMQYLKPGDAIAERHPHLFHLPGGREIPIDDAHFPNPWSIQQTRWSRDSQRFQFLYNQRGHQVVRIIAVDGETGETGIVVDEASDTFVDYAHKVYSHLVEDADEIIWMSERDGWNHLYRFDSRTGQLKNQVTAGKWVVRRVDHVDDAAQQIWFQAGGVFPEQDPYFVHFGRINFDGTGLTWLTAGNGTHTVTYSPDKRFLIDQFSRVDLPPITELRRVSDGRLVCELERGDARELAAAGWRAPERFVAKGRDGTTDIHGMIIRPTNFDETKKYPVIEHIYAGPHGAFVPKSFRPHRREHELAELGFVVVRMDGMGTSYRSKAFHDVCWKNLADSGFPDRILWIKAAARKDPSLDLSRVGIYGGSAGGQSALRAMLAHGDFYRAAVADCGCHDNRMDKIWWNELWMGWPLGPHYEEQSNVTNAHALQGQLLLIVGELDRNVDPASTMQVVDALIKADKDFELLVVPGGGHGIAESAYGKRRRRDFFVRHLLNQSPRWTPATAK